MKMKNLILIFVLSFIHSGGFSQDFPPDLDTKREKIREKIDIVMKVKLSEALDLSEAQAMKLFPILNEYQDKKEEIMRQRFESMRKLRTTLEAGDAGEDELRGYIRKWEESQQRIFELEKEEQNKLKEILTVEQQAKLLIAKPEIQNQIREIIQQVRKDRRGQFPRRRR